MNRKISKAERIALITKTLIEHPSKIFTLQYFSELLSCAKSTLSEDIQSIEQVFEEKGFGEIRSVAGAAGGIYYAPIVNAEQLQSIKEALCEELIEHTRIIPGGYLYMNDIMYNPKWLLDMSKCIATEFMGETIDYVITIETKGIPIALTLANLLNKPIVVLRKSARLTEGTTIQMNYVTGSQKSIKTMAMPIRSIHRGARVLFVDDFMKAGGTAKGIIDLMKEFDATVVGTAVVMVATEPKNKLIDDYFALVEFKGIDEEHKSIHVLPYEKL